MGTVVSLELNEINFDFLRHFIAEGKLPTFKRLLDDYQLFETDAGETYPFLEPWIQWPTVYTGLEQKEHELFRLGDAPERDTVNIWEYLEQRGLKVGAISPINAANRCSNAAYFLPDPWTVTPLTASPSLASVYGLIKELVNNNASEGRSMAQLGAKLLPLAWPYLSTDSLASYIKIAWTAKSHRWARAAFLDRLLADMHFSLLKTERPNFSSLFLNAGAHIQHHHMFDSAIYSGSRSNPSWYSSASGRTIDPLLFIYQVYDSILADHLSLPDVRLLITTGISQYANEREHYQYRIVDLDSFIQAIGIDNANAVPRMSRDFLLEFEDTESARSAVEKLNLVSHQGKPVFSIEDRGNSLFCQFAYFGPPSGLSEMTIAQKACDLSKDVTLVSIENGVHQAKGYHIDTYVPAGTYPGGTQIPLATLFDRMAEAALTKTDGLRRAA